MAIIIQNVTQGERPDSEPHDYVVRINDQMPITRFEHTPFNGLSVCLRKAADAIDAYEQTAHYAQHMPENL